jgi:hypothetical protein
MWCKASLPARVPQTCGTLLYFRETLSMGRARMAVSQARTIRR